MALLDVGLRRVAGLLVRRGRPAWGRRQGTKPDATHADASARDAAREAHSKEATAPDAAIGTGVLQHHGDGTRAGVYVDPAFTKEAALGLEPLPGFSFTFPPFLIGGSAGTEQVLAQVLFASNAVQGTDALFVATESDNIYAVNAETGAKLWKTSVGTDRRCAVLPLGLWIGLPARRHRHPRHRRGHGHSLRRRDDRDGRRR